MLSRFASIFAGTKGYLDKIAVVRMWRFEAGLLKHLRSTMLICEDITDNDQKVKGDMEDKIKAAIDAFAETFA